MILELCSSENLPPNEVVIKCERMKTCETGTWEYAVDQQDEDMIRYFCTQLFYKHGNIDLAQLSNMYGDVYWFHLFDRDGNVDSNQTLFKHGNVGYNELIAYWMMEGYLGHVDSVEETYEKGHDIFMDIAYNEIPTLEASREEISNSLASGNAFRRYRGFYGASRLGLVNVFDKGEMPKLGDLVPDRGVVRTLDLDHEWSCSSLLLDGNELGRQVVRHLKRMDLKYFAYFNPKPSLLRSSLRDFKLSVLVLRGCMLLEEIDDCIGEMITLTVLEISGPGSIKRIPGSLFTELTGLRSLNLSHLPIEALPEKGFSKLLDLRKLILRGCTALTELPSIKVMTKLEVVDLYGATSFRKMSTTKVRGHQIQMLDLSCTQINRVPCLINPSDVSCKVTHLFLRNCSQIRVFDIVEKMASLQVLDLSGAKGLLRIKTLDSLVDLIVLDLSQTGLDSLPKSCLQNLKKLQDLNLSKTNISSIPSISHLSSLRKLIVQDCLLLKALPEMEGLASLEVLDLSGCTSLENVEEIPFWHFTSLRRLNLANTNIEKLLTFQGASSSQHSQVHFLQDSKQLQVLNLSKTSVKELPDMSHLKSLKQLSLAGCSQFTVLPDLKALTELEVLDLSGTSVGNELMGKVPTSLRRLSLKDCSTIKGSLSLASLTLLQEIDLQGTIASEFPYEISDMAHLKCLRLPDTIDITRVDWGGINCLPKEIVWDQRFEALKSAKILTSNGNTHCMSVKAARNADLFHLVDKQHLWEGYFKEFSFSVSPSRKVNRNSEMYFDGDELVFKGNHPSTVKFPNIKPQDQSVEIHGFSSFPEEARSALEKAVNVALVGNSFIASLSDECFQSMEAMKVCWLKRCTEMKFVLEGENHCAGFLKGLETLVLSNLVNLVAVCAENVPSPCIDFLKHMYIDCCPVLEKIFTESHLPKQLQTLHIKFCDALKAVCGENTSLCRLPELHKLHLLALPELQHIGAHLPSLHTLVISECPKLSPHVFCLSMLPESIQELEIRSCEGLTTLFESAGSSTSMSQPSLPNLHRLQLWNLPKLESIGGDFPRLQTRQIGFCPRLQRDLWPKVKNSSNPDD